MDTHYSVEIAAHRKVAEARRAAAHDRLAVVAVQVRRGTGQGMPSRLARLLRGLASAYRHGRPELESTVQAGHAP